MKKRLGSKIITWPSLIRLDSKICLWRFLGKENFHTFPKTVTTFLSQIENGKLSYLDPFLLLPAIIYFTSLPRISRSLFLLHNGFLLHGKLNFCRVGNWIEFIYFGSFHSLFLLWKVFVWVYLLNISRENKEECGRERERERPRLY